MQAYLDRTEEQRSEENRLFISLNSPFSSVTTSTIRNIFISAMEQAKIDTSKFGPHSARSSATAAPGLSLKQILAMGCWKNKSTFKKHYQAILLK